GRLELALDLLGDAPAIVVVDRQAEAARAARHRLSDPPHADDAQALTPDAVAEHAGRAPAAPGTAAHEALAFGQAPRHRQDQPHGHVGRVLGEDAGRVGHGDAALARRL